ncbi:transcriptional regulator BolA [Xanthomonas fragariae]|uniref:Transcriptional regulator BolA n=1 Tax=Xanthomonas fragariae TaxID=48664 RepID=A0ABY1RPD2_9XANT|nr:transcriptional regulator BolA [Xanthomonas fragariae]
MSRVERIRIALQTALAPSELEVVDDSHRHAGHAGARDGRGHFNVRMVSAAFADKPQAGAPSCDLCRGRRDDADRYPRLVDQSTRAGRGWIGRRAERPEWQVWWTGRHACGRPLLAAHRPSQYQKVPKLPEKLSILVQPSACEQSNSATVIAGSASLVDTWASDCCDAAHSFTYPSLADA